MPKDFKPMFEILAPQIGYEERLRIYHEAFTSGEFNVPNYWKEKIEQYENKRNL